MQDIELKCRDCGETFTFTAGEQEFYQQKGFTNQPTRCPEKLKETISIQTVIEKKASRKGRF